MQYRREIDGLRAVAVVPVVLFHAGATLFSGGYVGVDVFFVISGYLITTIIAAECDAGTFSVARFYERRARRILPALFAVLAACLPFAWVWMTPAQFQDFAQALVAVSLFASNVLFWLKTDYFGPAAEENPLLHTWSLAVEEQFYIVFPLLLLVLWRSGRPRLVQVVLVLSAISLAMAEWGWRTMPAANFYLIPFRAWELGAGALCAFALTRERPTPLAGFRAAAASGLGLALILGAVFLYDDKTPFPSLYAVVPVAGAALVILFADATTPVGRLLGQPVFVRIGLISYSLYLWHQPLFALARIRSLTVPSAALMAVLAGLAVVLASLTWRFVEQPFRTGPLRRPLLARRGALFAAAAAGLAAFTAIGIFGHVTDGRAAIWAGSNPGLAATHRLIEGAHYVAPVFTPCRFAARALDTATLDRLATCHRTYGAGTLVLGDSHGVDLFDAMVALDDGDFLVGLTAPGCTVYIARRTCNYAAIASYVADNHGIFQTVLYHQAGHGLLATESGRTGRRIFTEVPEDRPVNPATHHVDGLRVEQVYDYLGQLAESTRVVWIGPRTEPQIRMNYVLRNGCDFDFRLRPGQAEVFSMLDEGLRAAAAGRGVTYVSLIDATRLELPRDFIDCGAFYWRDGDHWSPAGAARFVRRLLESGALDIAPQSVP